MHPSSPLSLLLSCPHFINGDTNTWRDENPPRHRNADIYLILKSIPVISPSHELAKEELMAIPNGLI